MLMSAGDLEKAQQAISSGIWFILSAAGLTDVDNSVREKAMGIARAAPLNRIVVCSDSPWRTPQNLPGRLELGQC